MPETVFYIIMLLLTVLGVLFCIREFLLLLLVVPRHHNISIVLPLSGHAEDVEYTVMCIVKRNRWFDRFKNADIVLLDCGMDEETAELCKALSKRYREVKIVKSCEAVDYLSKPHDDYESKELEKSGY